MNENKKKKKIKKKNRAMNYSAERDEISTPFPIVFADLWVCELLAPQCIVSKRMNIKSAVW